MRAEVRTTITRKIATFVSPAQGCGSQCSRNTVRISFLSDSIRSISWDTHSLHSYSLLDPQREQKQLSYASYCGSRYNHKTNHKFRQLWNINNIWPRSCFWYIRTWASCEGWFYQASCKFCLLLSKCMLTDKNRVDSSQAIFGCTAIMVQDVIASK